MLLNVDILRGYMYARSGYTLYDELPRTFTSYG
jgi:hypothetical protein